MTDSNEMHDRFTVVSTEIKSEVICLNDIRLRSSDSHALSQLQSTGKKGINVEELCSQEKYYFNLKVRF